MLACSFCRKGSAAVKKMIAGPGVAICNECVDLCLGIVSAHELSYRVGAEAPLADLEVLEQLEDDQLLLRLEPARLAATAIETNLRAIVTMLRERNVSWTRIGEALKMSRQSAWERFADES